MLFNSYTFLFGFLPVTLLGIYVLAGNRWTRCTIWFAALASVVFYGLGNAHFVPLLLASIIVNYLLGNAILRSASHGKATRLLLTAGVAGNLGTLAYFKYTNFLLANMDALTGWHVALAPIVLPVGISFYTFTQIAFLVDCRRGESHRYRFGDYLLFVSFFPHLVAGPILNHKAILPQFEAGRFGMPSSQTLYRAAVFFSVGLFKKVVIADSIAGFVHTLFDQAPHLSFLGGWMAALLYTFQLYYDFSGYSEMAVGIALLMNITIPINFNSPYKSASIIEFWRRWHISLSLFLRDYLYIPLGGSRKGKGRRYLNLLMTMGLGGMWHGAGWTFILWGLLHGAGLAINHAWRDAGKSMPVNLARLITFVFIVIGWVFFRAADIPQALSILTAMAGLHPGAVSPVDSLPDFSAAFLWIVTLLGWSMLAPNTQQIADAPQPRLRTAVLMAMLLISALMGIDQASDFLYFKF